MFVSQIERAGCCFSAAYSDSADVFLLFRLYFGNVLIIEELAGQSGAGEYIAASYLLLRTYTLEGRKEKNCGLGFSGDSDDRILSGFHDGVYAGAYIGRDYGNPVRYKKQIIFHNRQNGVLLCPQYNFFCDLSDDSIGETDAEYRFYSFLDRKIL